jgi:hypothetical protein
VVNTKATNIIPARKRGQRLLVGSKNTGLMVTDGVSIAGEASLAGFGWVLRDGWVMFKYVLKIEASMQWDTDAALEFGF